MTEMDLESRFRGVHIEKFSSYGGGQSCPESLYWKHLNGFPLTIQEVGAINAIDISDSSGLIAVTSSSRIQLYNPESTHEVFKSLNKFRCPVWGASFRQCGNLVGLGSDDGKVKIVDVNSKTILRDFSGHAQPVRKVHFTEDKSSILSFSDDKTVKLWDIPSQECVITWKDEHSDYIRAGKSSPVSSDLVLSGSYDHTAKLWDKRTRNSTLTVDHGSPIEDLLVFPNGSLVATAGGHEIKIWDLLSGGKFLTKITPHSKTITSISFCHRNKRLVSASLDRQVKITDISDFKTVHSASFPSSLLSCRVSQDDSVLVAGSVDGLIQFMHRKDPKTHQEIREEKHRKKNFKFLQYTGFEPREGDIIVEADKIDKEPRYDHFLRKFEYAKALDQVLKQFVQRRHPEHTYSVLKEIERRNGLTQALGGRDEKSLALLLQFVCKNINEPRFSDLMIRVAEYLLKLYSNTLGNCPTIDKLFDTIKRKVDREVRNMKTLMELQGALDLILTASKSAESPCLRVEEINYQKRKKEVKNIHSTTFEKLLLSN